MKLLRLNNALHHEVSSMTIRIVVVKWRAHTGSCNSDWDFISCSILMPYRLPLNTQHRIQKGCWLHISRVLNITICIQPHNKHLAQNKIDLIKLHVKQHTINTTTWTLIWKKKEKTYFPLLITQISSQCSCITEMTPLLPFAILACSIFCLQYFFKKWQQSQLPFFPSITMMHKHVTDNARMLWLLVND